MFCPSGHTIDAAGKRLRLFAYHYTCTRCGGKVSENGGLYHKCAARCEFRLCKRCYDRALAKHYVLEPCTEAFPTGLGPFSLHRSSLKGEDLRPFDVARGRQVDPFSGGAWALGGSFFSRSRALSSVWSALVGSGLTMHCHPSLFQAQAKGSGRRAAGFDVDRCISVLVSPAAPVNIPELTRRMMSIPEGPGLMVAWVYPVQVEWQALAPDMDESSVGGTEWSLLTVGGFIYMRKAPAVAGGVEVLCANSIAYSPRGIVNFSAAQPWRQAWTNHLLAAGRFQKVTAQRWAAAGAKYMCWVAPEEKIVEPHGLHGGFAFLFHELDEEDGENRDRFFEIVTTLGIPTFAGAFGGSMNGSGLMPPMLQRSAFAFSLAGDPASATQAHLERTRARFLRAAGEGRWALVGHMLGEWPYLATEADDRGQTALHKCAALSGVGPGGRLTHQLLAMLHEGGASIEARDIDGRTPYDLGDHCFKALVCQIWGLIPDIFADPELWFDYWDKDHDGVLLASELIPALAAAYQVGDLGRQWIETYVHTHYRELAPGSQLTRESYLGDKGLLHVLQSSEEFISLREKEAGTSQMPVIFRTEGRQRPTSFDKTILDGFGERLEAIRNHYGWVLGKPPPPGARPLEVRAPFAGGESDPYARLVAAREMLAWSFTKTTALPGSTWLSGFKVAFKGGDDAGIDEGGLTKAWCTEIAYALFADEAYFDSKSTGCFFKPDAEIDLLLHCFHVKSDSFYRWVGRFMAYATYHGCMIDCRLCPWALRWLVRVTQSRAQTPGMLLNLAGDWQRLPGGADGAVADGAPAVATISGRALIRHDDCDESTTLARELALSFEDGRLHADLDGQRQSADVRDGKLFWSNGEVWARSADSSPLAGNATMPFWPETPEGNDQLLEDLATMDAAFANSLWRVAHEMPDEDLQWLTFSYAGLELEAGGEDCQVDASNKGRYVRLCCKAVLLQRARRGLQAFAEGFFDVFPQELVTGMPADSFMWLLCGDDEISAEQIDLLERLVLSDGLVPQHLSENVAVIESARWVFNVARSSDGRFRSRLLEFWTGTPRLPAGGVCAIAPRPRLQVMVQAAKPAAPPVWEICLQDGWYSYDLDTAASLESAFCSSAGQNAGSVTIAVRSNKYVVDLAAMVQVNTRTGARREIRRREQPAEEEIRHGVRRIDTWPQGRLPEGHTCGNELWVPLCDSEEELTRSLQLAVMNFEAGFALA